MAANLPESTVPDIRDYLYVDTMRVRSLLAQTDDGVRDERSASSSRSRRLRLGSKLTGYERGSDLSEAETMSLADLHVSMLEESAEALGLLADVSEKITKEKNWLRGKVRSRLQPAMLLRVTAPTLLIDTESLQQTFRGMQEATGADDEEFDQFLSMLGALYGSGIAVSIRPTSDDSARAAFVGAIPKDHGFTPLARELLLSRVGPEPQIMTSLVQVARVPAENQSQQPLEASLDSLMARFEAMSSEALDRELLDGLLMKMASMMEQAGLAAAPRWPAISVQPLAIYRNVLPVPRLDEDA